MANTKSAKKRAIQSEKRRVANFSRKTAVKSAIKKVNDALASGADQETTANLLKVAQSKLARAKGKGVLPANTVSRKVGRLSKRVAAAHRTGNK
jgi:small subunit ribosomal protein S20